MSNIYFIRHGQAGTRDLYDSLSELGRRQARLLGEHLVSQEIEFAAAYVGALARQQQTAAEVATPTAIWTGRALEVSDAHVRRLAAVLLNTSYTILQLRDEEMLLLTFNAVPHLNSPEIRTRR